MHLGSIIGGVVGGTAGLFLGGPGGAAAGWSAGSSLGAGFDSSQGQTETNNANVRLAQDQMAFQDKESSTSYQRGVKDMEAAGLNPMLAYSQGGASSPGGAMPVMQNPVAAGTSSAAQSAQASAAMAQIEYTKAQTAKTIGETVTQQATADNLDAQTNQMTASAQAAAANARNTAYGYPKTEQDARAAKIDADTKLQVFKAMSQEGRGVPASDTDSGFTADVQKRRAQAMQEWLALPAAKASANYYSGMGAASPYIDPIVSILKGAMLGKGLTK